MKKFTLITTDNYKQQSGYAKILSLSTKYSNHTFATNNWSAILDVYFVGLYGTYGLHGKYSISWSSKNTLKIVMLNDDIEKKLPNNIFAIVPTDDGLDLYVTSHLPELSLNTKIDVLSFNSSGKWYNNSTFEDITSLSPTYYSNEYKSSIINSNLKNFLNKYIYSDNKSYVELNLDEIGALKTNMFFISARSFKGDGTIKGMDFYIKNDGSVYNKQPYIIASNETELALEINETTNTIKISNIDWYSNVFVTITIA